MRSTVVDGEHVFAVINSGEIGNRLWFIEATDEHGRRCTVVTPFRNTSDEGVRQALSHAFALEREIEANRCDGLLQFLPGWHSTPDGDATTP